MAEYFTHILYTATGDTDFLNIAPSDGSVIHVKATREHCFTARVFGEAHIVLLSRVGAADLRDEGYNCEIANASEIF
jgi:hypothetical protein